MSGKLRNAPCWCGSGQKYKKCHLDRDSQPRANPFDVAERQLKLFRRKQCLYPNAPEGCNGKIVRAHTVRRRADLGAIARDGHVYSGRADLSTLIRTGGRVEATLIGINEASTFLGFCAHHDQTTFAPLELQPFAATQQQCFLLTYRNLCRELYVKAAQHDSTNLWRDSDRGKAIQTQVAIQHLISTMQAAMRESLSNLRFLKDLYDAELLTNNHENCRYTVLHLDSTPTIVCGGLASPSFDFDGTRLQNLDVLGVDRFAVISFSLVATEAGGVAVYSWRPEDDAVAVPFTESLLRVPTKRQADALVRFAYETVENTFAAPEWWEGLSKSKRVGLEARLSSGASPEHPTQPAALKDDGVRYVDWQVSRVESSANGLAA